MSKNNVIEVRALSAELRSEGESRIVSGYAAKFNTKSEPIGGWFIETIARGAFDDADMTDVIMCINHDPSLILARTSSGTLKIEIDEVGLRFEFTLPNTSLANDTMEHIKLGNIEKCSFRFVVAEDDWTYANNENKLQYDQRTITKFRAIRDTSLVVFPAYKDTEASLRHLEERKSQFFAADPADKNNSPEPTAAAWEAERRNRNIQILNLKK